MSLHLALTMSDIMTRKFQCCLAETGKNTFFIHFISFLLCTDERFLDLTCARKSLCYLFENVFINTLFVIKEDFSVIPPCTFLKIFVTYMSFGETHLELVGKGTRDSFMF